MPVVQKPSQKQSCRQQKTKYRQIHKPVGGNNIRKGKNTHRRKNRHKEKQPPRNQRKGFAHRKSQCYKNNCRTNQSSHDRRMRKLKRLRKRIIGTDAHRPNGLEKIKAYIMTQQHWNLHQRRIERHCYISSPVLRGKDNRTGSKKNDKERNLFNQSSFTRSTQRPKVKQKQQKRKHYARRFGHNRQYISRHRGQKKPFFAALCEEQVEND